MISTLTTSEEGGCKSKLDRIKNNKVYSTILEGSEITQDANKSSRTELDSHANMPVIGMNAYILSKIGETVDPYLICCANKDLRLIIVEKELCMANLLYSSSYSQTIDLY